MKVSLNVLVMSTLLCSMLGTTASAETPQTARLLSTVREQMAGGSMEEAIHALESALEEAPEEDCTAIVEQLRKAYQVSIYQSRQAGRHDLADHYAQNLKLIDSATSTNGIAPGSESTQNPVRRIEAPSPQTIDNGSATTIPKAPSRADLAPPRTAPDKIVDSPETNSNHQASSTTDSQTVQIPVPPIANAEPIDQGLKNERSSNVQQFDIAEADDAFRAKKYAEAGRLYQGLMETGNLPDSRRGHLAYCRSAALVEKINKGPASTGDWEDIRQEIEQIQNIQPDFWFAEYLSDLVRERMNRTASNSTQLAVNNNENAGFIERTSNQIKSINPLRKIIK